MRADDSRVIRLGTKNTSPVRNAATKPSVTRQEQQHKLISNNHSTIDRENHRDDVVNNEDGIDLFHILSEDFDDYRKALKESMDDLSVQELKASRRNDNENCENDIGINTEEIFTLFHLETIERRKQTETQTERLYIQLESQKHELAEVSSDILQLRQKLLGQNESIKTISPRPEMPSINILYLKLPSKNFEAPFMHYDATKFSIRKGSDLVSFNVYKFFKICTNFSLSQLDDSFSSVYLEPTVQDYLVFLQGPQDTHKDELTMRLATIFISKSCQGLQIKNQLVVRLVSVTSNGTKVADVSLALLDWKKEIEKVLDSMKSSDDSVKLMQPGINGQDEHPLPAEFLFIELQHIKPILEGYEVTSQRASRVKYIVFAKCRKRYSTAKNPVSLDQNSVSLSFSQSPSGSNRSDFQTSSLAQCLQECADLSSGRSFEWQLRQLNLRSRSMKRLVLVTFEPIYGRIFHTEEYLHEFDST